MNSCAPGAATPSPELAGQQGTLNTFRLACSVYPAYREEDLGYPFIERVLGNLCGRRHGTALDGMKVWPDRSPQSGLAAMPSGRIDQ